MFPARAAVIVTFLFVVAGCSDSAPTAPSSRSPVAPSASSSAETEQTRSARLATGYIEINTGAAKERYSFIAVSSTGSPSTKGGVAWHATTPDGSALDIIAELDCLAITDNQAWMSGPVKKFTFNGQPQPATQHVRFRVIDNGQGKKSLPDAGSGMFFSDPLGCQARPPLATYASSANRATVHQAVAQHDEDEDNDRDSRQR
jgi:hypothetical protein